MVGRDRGAWDRKTLFVKNNEDIITESLSYLVSEIFLKGKWLLLPETARSSSSISLAAVTESGHEDGNIEIIFSGRCQLMEEGARAPIPPFSLRKISILERILFYLLFEWCTLNQITRNELQMSIPSEKALLKMCHGSEHSRCLFISLSPFGKTNTFWAR